jgi:tRNA G18 (ribose-2'-O)-methylase SpoU
LYLCGITGYPPVADDPRPPWVADRAGRVIAKTAIQTVRSVPWEYRPSAVAVIRELKDRGAQIAALEPNSESVDYTRVHYQFPVCLVVGHERSGISDPILALADLIVGIPMFGQGTSLNVAMALAICAYEIIRNAAGQLPR